MLLPPPTPQPLPSILGPGLSFHSPLPLPSDTWALSPLSNLPWCGSCPSGEKKEKGSSHTTPSPFTGGLWRRRKTA